MAERKSLFSNSVYNVLYKLLNVFFPLISASYISHVLQATGVGKVASAQNITQYFVLIAALGIPNYGTREIAKVRELRKLTNKLFTELFVINLGSTVLCSIAYYTLITLNHQFFDDLRLYYTTGLLIILNALNVDWYYQGMEEYKYIALRSTAMKIMSFICLLLFVKEPTDYITYAFIYVVAIGGNYIFNIINLKKHGVKFELYKLDISKHIKPVVVLLCTTIAVELYTLLDTTMITYYCAAENVAYYANSIKIVRVLITVVSAIGGVLLPRLSYYRQQNMIEQCGVIVNKIFYIMFFIFLPCGIGLILTADIIQPMFFGSSFAPAAETLRIAALLIYTLGFSNLFGTQVLLTFDSEKKLLLCTAVGAVTNVIMNACFIPRFQQNGAAVASVISEFIVTILCVYFANKYIHLVFSKKIILPALIGCTLMAIVVFGIRYFIGASRLSVILQIVLGAITYVGINTLLKNPVLIELMHIVDRRKVVNVKTPVP